MPPSYSPLPPLACKLKDWTEKLEEALKANGKKKVTIPTVFTAAPGVLEAFAETEYAARLKATGVITSYICPLMYMNNPLCKKMPVITSSNKLRTYTSARYYTDAEILMLSQEVRTHEDLSRKSGNLGRDHRRSCCNKAGL